ncbi:MAG: sensor histidine kinase [Romboutsia sp.]|uniref:sensor histidine kinase n=1 Tax=Romboutsia sp. TaxID=1965302 RepID=UPI003F2C4EC6
MSFEDQVKGLKEGLGQNVNLEIEYMDSKVLYTPKNEEKFYQLLKYTLSNYDGIDAIVVGDDEALEFCLRYREDIFKDIPMVFFAASRDDLIQRALSYDLTSGVKEIESIDTIMEMIENLHKDVENIIFLNNYNNSLHTEKFYNDSILKYDNLNFEKVLTSELTINEFKNKLTSLDDDDAIVRFYPAEFKDDDWISNEEINNMIKENLNNTPVYNVLNYGIGDGSIIGGKVISHFKQGKKAGEIVLDILDGKNAKELYIGDDGANEYIFDYKELKKFHIKKNNLPKESIILNNPLDMIKKHKEVLISLICVFLGLVSTIIALVGYMFYRKKYEKSILKAMHAAEEVNRLKAHFMSNISHELKTPITVIMSVMQLSKLSSTKKDNEYLAISNDNFELISTNCYRLLRLLNNILDVEKVDSGEINLNLKNINIIEIVEETVLSVVPYAKSKNLELMFDTNCEEVIMAIDCDKIERIVLNLLSNAIKFSKDSGTIMVYMDKKDDNIIFYVEDNGVGMNENDSRKIFDRFIQIDDSLTRKNEGSGIGLSIVKAFTNLHNGSIEVKSKINEGTRFTLKLPIIKVCEEENNYVYIHNDEELNRNTKVELSDIYF